MLAEDDPVKMEMDIVDEQVDTVGRAFLGLTLGCARCHDHKFDPIPTADYYALAGIFKSTKTMENYKVVARWHGAAAGRRRKNRDDSRSTSSRSPAREGEIKRARESRQAGLREGAHRRPGRPPDGLAARKSQRAIACRLEKEPRTVREGDAPNLPRAMGVAESKRRRTCASTSAAAT